MRYLCFASSFALVLLNIFSIDSEYYDHKVAMKSTATCCNRMFAAFLHAVTLRKSGVP